ncbi:MAG TPA: S9 family peptidase [Bacillota bacterium]|nr:S9 family peptidase [Bacillota bacterium]
MARHGMRIEDLLDFRFPGDAQIDPAGRRVALVLSEFDRERNGYKSSIWLADLEGGSPRRLTWSGRRDRQPRWSPDGARLAFLSERAGEDQVWVLDLEAGGEARQLTSRKGGVSAFTWSPDSRSLCLVGRDPRPEPQSPPGPDARYITRLRYKANGEGYRDDRRAHLYVADAATGECRQLTQGPWDDAEPAWSPDGRTIAFTSARGDEADPWFGPDLYTAPAAGGDAQPLVHKAGGLSAPAFSPDGAQVAFLAGAGRESGENIDIWLVPARGGDARCLTRAFDHHAGCAVGSDLRRDAGQSGPVWVRDGRSLLAIFADGPAARLYRFDATTGACTIAAGEGAVTVSSFSATADGGLIAGICGDATHPAEAWAWAGGDPRPLTSFNADVLSTMELSAPEHVAYESFDGQMIDAWVLRPLHAEAGRRYPLILEVHGGPHAAYGHGIFHEFQIFAALGYGVLYTNPRGSIGYGEAFTQACVDDWGGGDYKDVMAAADMACSWDWVDPERLGITGGSYGGFMTNWVIGHTTRFAAAVTLRSVVNFFTKYGVADNGWMHNSRELGGADLWADEEKVFYHSPLRYVRNVKTPTLVIHSDEDYRCPLPEGEQLYVALRRLGVPTAFVRFTGENHELSRGGKPANRLERLRQMAAWFDRHLRPRV